MGATDKLTVVADLQLSSASARALKPAADAAAKLRGDVEAVGKGGGLDRAAAGGLKLESTFNKLSSNVNNLYRNMLGLTLAVNAFGSSTEQSTQRAIQKMLQLAGIIEAIRGAVGIISVGGSVAGSLFGGGGKAGGSAAGAVAGDVAVNAAGSTIGNVAAPALGRFLSRRGAGAAGAAAAAAIPGTSTQFVAGFGGVTAAAPAAAAPAAGGGILAGVAGAGTAGIAGLAALGTLGVLGVEAIYKGFQGKSSTLGDLGEALVVWVTDPAQKALDKLAKKNADREQKEAVRGTQLGREETFRSTFADVQEQQTALGVRFGSGRMLNRARRFEEGRQGSALSAIGSDGGALATILGSSGLAGDRIADEQRRFEEVARGNAAGIAPAQMAVRDAGLRSQRARADVASAQANVERVGNLPLGEQTMVESKAAAERLAEAQKKLKDSEIERLAATEKLNDANVAALQSTRALASEQAQYYRGLAAQERERINATKEQFGGMNKLEQAQTRSAVGMAKQFGFDRLTPEQRQRAAPFLGDELKEFERKNADRSGFSDLISGTRSEARLRTAESEAAKFEGIKVGIEQKVQATLDLNADSLKAEFSSVINNVFAPWRVSISDLQTRVQVIEDATIGRQVTDKAVNQPGK